MKIPNHCLLKCGQKYIVWKDRKHNSRFLFITFIFENYSSKIFHVISTIAKK